MSGNTSGYTHSHLHGRLLSRGSGYSGTWTPCLVVSCPCLVCHRDHSHRQVSSLLCSEPRRAFLLLTNTLGALILREVCDLFSSCALLTQHSHSLSLLAIPSAHTFLRAFALAAPTARTFPGQHLVRYCFLRVFSHLSSHNDLGSRGVAQCGALARQQQQKRHSLAHSSACRVHSLPICCVPVFPTATVTFNTQCASRQA